VPTQIHVVPHGQWFTSGLSTPVPSHRVKSLFCVDREGTAEHVLMNCSRLAAEWKQLKALTGTPLSTSSFIVASSGKFCAVLERCNGPGKKFCSKSIQDK